MGERALGEEAVDAAVETDTSNDEEVHEWSDVSEGGVAEAELRVDASFSRSDSLSRRRQTPPHLQHQRE